ncbi:MAG: TonB-dependent receptor domain-containing protein, partial [Terriglobia bacterium]
MRFQNINIAKALSSSAAVLLALSFFVSLPARAQVAGATLSGAVTDPTGAVIPNARISIQNTATGVVRLVTTDASGFYSAPNLLPGSYKVTVTASGFTTTVESAITLTVGAQQTLNVSMKLGQTSQTVTVAGAAPTVQLASSAMSAEVTATTLRELPLNGRDWTQLATLQPGVNAVVTQSSTNSATANRANRGFGNQLSDSGHSPYENNYRVDGISVNDYSNGSPGSVIGENLGVDAIGQFSVLTTNYSAAYGRSSGAVINAITKSGSNQIHGSAYEFLRNSNLDAANFFDNFGNIQKPPFRRNQFGGSVGGPIQKDKTFYFGDYEGVRQALGVTFTDNVPTAAARQCVLSGGNVTVSPAVQPYLPFWPLPNHPVAAGSDIGKFSVATNQVISENFFQVRIDHTFSKSDTLSGTGLFDRGPQTQPDALNNVLTELLSFRQMYGLEETHIFSPALVNTARFGYSRSHGINGGVVGAINPIAADAALGVFPGRNAPILSVPGLAGTNSVGSASRNLLVQNSFQFYDDAFLTKGSHSLKLGFAAERVQFNNLTRQRTTGNFSFGGLAQFLQGTPTSFIGLGTGSGLEEGTRQTLFGLYAQDDWRAKSNLTLNLGLRYEPVTLPTEAHDLQQKLFGLTSPTLTPSKTAWLDNQTLHNLEPRVGFAWDPFRTGKTSVRGGFGIFDILPLPYTFNQSSAGEFPFQVIFSANKLVAGDFPVVKSKPLGPSSTNVQLVPPDPSNSYAMNWNFDIQRAITSSLSFTIAYVGSRTIHRPDALDD